jgi:serine/threonine protein kinase/tetratricopeptide (TPR) repeat protein
VVGETISHYRILEKLGEGGMGVVYRARDEHLHRDVALKMLPARTLQGEEARTLFRREAIALAKVSHPNIEAVFEFDSQDGVDFLATELVPGHTLAKQLEEGPLPEPAVVDTGLQITAALEEAHEQHVIHCDLKPSNIMVTPKGQVKLLDFGLARILRIDVTDSTLSAIQTNETGGTLPYMAPEVLRGGSADQRTDIYAAGVILYEMATGQRPFSGSPAAQLIVSILSKDPVRPSALNKAVPADLERVILRCLEKDPAKRYQTAKQARAALRSVQSGDGAKRKITRRWTLGLSGAGLAAALTFLLWFTGTFPALPFSARDWIFVADFENQTGEPIFDKSLATAFHVSLEQSKHANVFPRSRTVAVLRRMGKEKAGRIDGELGREICLRENLRGLVTCGITKVGERYALSARLVNPANGDSVRSYLEQANGQNEVLDALGRIAVSVRRDLGESLASISQNVRPLARVTTPSLQTLKYYSEAVYSWSKGNFDEAVRMHEEALKIDPEFAMGHSALGVCYLSHIYNEKEKGRQHLQRALQLSSRVSDRERMLIEIQHTNALGDFNNAVQAYRSYLLAYPDDPGTHYSFATSLMQRNRTEEAIEQFKQVLRVAPRDASSLINLATSYSQLDRIPEALSSYAKAFELEPTWVTSTNLNHEYGFAFVRAGKIPKARELFNLALNEPKIKTRGLRSHGLLDLYEGRYADAARRFREAAALNESEKSWLSAARDRLFLSIAQEGVGNRTEQLRELDAALAALRSQNAYQAWLEARIGAAYARAGALEKANRIHQEMNRRANRQVAEELADLHLLEGEVLLARGEAARAIEVLSLPDRPASPILRQISLSRAYERNNDTERAMAARSTVIADTGRALGWEAQQDWIEAHYLQARAHAAKGERSEAAELLGVIERLWKSADPGLPLLKQVQQLRVELGTG